MIEICSKCGRDRPDSIADPSCDRGGYCNWIDARTYPQDNSLFVVDRLVAFKFEGVRGFVIGRVARVTDIDVNLTDAYGVGDIDATDMLVSPARLFGRAVVNRARFTVAIDCPDHVHKAAAASVKRVEDGAVDWDRGKL